jgi:hypothetical protein
MGFFSKIGKAFKKGFKKSNAWLGKGAKWTRNKLHGANKYISAVENVGAYVAKKTKLDKATHFVSKNIMSGLSAGTKWMRQDDNIDWFFDKLVKVTDVTDMALNPEGWAYALDAIPGVPTSVAQGIASATDLGLSFTPIGAELAVARAMSSTRKSVMHGDEDFLQEGVKAAGMKAIKKLGQTQSAQKLSAQAQALKTRMMNRVAPSVMDKARRGQAIYARNKGKIDTFRKGVKYAAAADRAYNIFDDMWSGDDDDGPRHPPAGDRFRNRRGDDYYGQILESNLTPMPSTPGDDSKTYADERRREHFRRELERRKAQPNVPENELEYLSRASEESLAESSSLPEGWDAFWMKLSSTGAPTRRMLPF